LPSPTAHIERFEHNGTSLIDEVLGDAAGRHLILLHGWAASRESLRGLGVLFEHTHTVHMIDLPGFGDAPPPPPDWGTIEYTDLIQQYVLERLPGTVVVVGHSFGGRVSVRLAARRMPQVRALVLIGVPGLPQPPFTWKALRSRWIRTLRRTLVALKPLIGNSGVEWHTRTYGSKDYLAAGSLRPILVRTVREDLTESAQTIACPTLLLWGSDDTETPVWLGQRYRDLLGSRGTLEVLPHKDHYPFNGTGAHLCGYKIRTWLGGVAGA
jgi:pimeloyl-ACP methyl ester carboxylesterase